jgi:hypothetical protein
MSGIAGINFKAYEVLTAIAHLSTLEKRLAAGMRAVQGIKPGYCSGASIDALIEASKALTEAYLEAINLTQRSKQYLLNAKSGFEAADLAAAEFFFALHGFGQIAMNGGTDNGQ